MKKLIIKQIKLGSREILQIEIMIPIDRIKKIDLDGGCSNSIKIITDDPADDFI